MFLELQVYITILRQKSRNCAKKRQNWEKNVRIEKEKNVRFKEKNVRITRKKVRF